MRLRNQPRNREGRTRASTPCRLGQKEIDQAKLSNLPSWRKKMIMLAGKVAEETTRRTEFFRKKGWLGPEEAL